MNEQSNNLAAAEADRLEDAAKLPGWPDDHRGDPIYWYRPDPKPDGVFDGLGSPREYAVFDLPDTNGQTVGGCMVYGRYTGPHPERDEWICNPPLRSLVTHLLSRSARMAEQLAALKSAAKVLLDGAWGGPPVADGERVVDAAELDVLRAAMTRDK